MKLESIKAVSFSYNTIKGSIEKRNNSIRKINDRIFNGILDKTDNNKINVSDINNIIRNTLPERKTIKIHKMGKNDEYQAFSCLTYGNNGDYSGYEIVMPFKKSKMNIDNLPIFMHELTHVLDNLFNPKFTKRQYVVETAVSKYGNEEMQLKYKKGFHLYEKDIYKREYFKNDDDKKKIIEDLSKKVKEYLSGKTVEEKIDYIQNTRYYLQSELNAYTTDNIYAKRMKDAGYEIDMSKYDNKVRNYMIKEKIDMLNKMGGDIISKARKRAKDKYYSSLYQK